MLPLNLPSMTTTFGRGGRRRYSIFKESKLIIPSQEVRETVCCVVVALGKFRLRLRKYSLLTETEAQALGVSQIYFCNRRAAT